MTDFEQPPVKTSRKISKEDLETKTQVTKFSLSNSSLSLTITRPDEDSYERRNLKTVPRASDIPSDYLAAINQWIAEGLR